MFLRSRIAAQIQSASTWGAQKAIDQPGYPSDASISIILFFRIRGRRHLLYIFMIVLFSALFTICL